MASMMDLGMPGSPPPTSLPTWKTAWDRALYGDDGFFRREAPAAHFRTSVHASTLFAQALVRLARSCGLDTIVDVGAGRGELLLAAQEADPAMRLLGVEVAPRPRTLPATIDWSSALPEQVEGLVIANEWLDNIPCHVVEVDDRGRPRVVHVDPSTGLEMLGSAIDEPVVPDSLRVWCDRWWPLDATEPGTRAEVGTTRDRAWRDVVRRVGRGVAVAVDYGHTRHDRPPFGSLRSYRYGVEVPLLADGTRDVTAHVAVDAVAAASHGVVLRQADALRTLGVAATRPALDGASTDPAGYLRGLAAASEAAELLETGGLGEFAWIVTTTGGCRWPP